MKNNRLFSAPLFMENLRRYWVISLCFTMLYLVCGPISIAMESDPVYVVRMVLYELNPGFLLLMLAVPLWASVCVYSYLHKTPSTGVMHAMPFSRGQLFTTSYLSGLVLALAPVALTAVFLFVVKRPAYVTETVTNFVNGSSYYTQTVNTGEDLFTAAAILQMAGRNMLVILYNYTVAVLAAVVCGNSLIQFLTACGFNLLLPALATLTICYCEVYLWGYWGSAFLDRMLTDLHPFLKLIEGDGKFGSPGWIALYLGAAALVFAASYALYARRPMENAGDSYVFDPVGKIIGMLIVLFSASIFGMGFQDSLGLLGYFIGGGVSFVIAQMIIRRTTRIFDKESLKPLLIGALCIVLFAGSFMGDWTGFETRVPDAADVESILLYSYDLLGSDLELKDPENIRRVTELHKEIIAHADAFRDFRTDGFENGSWTYLRMTYLMADGTAVQRDYNMPSGFADQSESLKAILRSDEARYYTADLEAMDMKDLRISFESYGADLAYEEMSVGFESADYSSELIPAAPEDEFYLPGYQLSAIDPAQKQKLVDALVADIRALPEVYTSPYRADEDSVFYGNLTLVYTRTGDIRNEENHRRAGSYWRSVSKSGIGLITEEYSYSITEDWPQTRQALAEIAVELSKAQ